MAKKKVEEPSQTEEDKTLEKESKRLRELALSRGLLSEKKAVPDSPLRPHAGIVRCDGKDICKKGHRKNKYLFSFPGLVAPIAGGKFGDLTQLDSRNPVLYVYFLQGRLKLFGTILYPKNKYITLNFVKGAGNIQCEDVFESLVVFSEAWWIGTKEENPDELRLDMPLDLQQGKHAVYDFAGGAGKPRNPKDGVDAQPSELELVKASKLESSKLSTPKGQLRMDKWLFQKKSSEKNTSEKSSDSNAKANHKTATEWVSDEDDEDFETLGDLQTASRQSARTAGKKHSYAESSEEEENGTYDSGTDDLDAELIDPGSKTVNKLFACEDAEYDFLVLESQASKVDVADTLNGNLKTEMTTINGNDVDETTVLDHLIASQTSAPRSNASGTLLSTPIRGVANGNTAGTGSKQSNLSAFFMKSSEKKKAMNVEPPASVVGTGSTRAYQRTKISKTILDEEDIIKEDKSLTSEAGIEPLLPFTPPDSNGSKRKRKATPEEKQTPKGAVGKGKTPAKRRKKAVEDSEPQEQLILVSDDSDAG